MVGRRSPFRGLALDDIKIESCEFRPDESVPEDGVEGEGKENRDEKGCQGYGDCAIGDGP